MLTYKLSEKYFFVSKNDIYVLCGISHISNSDIARVCCTEYTYDYLLPHSNKHVNKEVHCKGTINLLYLSKIFMAGLLC
jgi:hypothetical protein